MLLLFALHSLLLRNKVLKQTVDWNDTFAAERNAWKYRGCWSSRLERADYGPSQYKSDVSRLPDIRDSRLWHFM